MRNPRPVCPNSACSYAVAPPAGFYRKRGYYRPKHNHQPVPRYECKGCGRFFSATVVKAIRAHHRPDLNQHVFKLAVSGVSMRRMVALLGCSRTTIDRKIAHLAGEAQKHHAKRLASMQTSFVMVDELETFLHARYKQLAVPVAIRAKTGEVIAFAVGRKPSSMKAGIQGNRWVIDDRPMLVPRVLSAVGPALKPGATIATDSHPQYPKWIGRTLPGVKHQKLLAIHEPGHDPLFAINLAFAKMRNDLARLGRKTWTTTKSIKALENHLWLWVAWTNGYPLK